MGGGAGAAAVPPHIVVKQSASRNRFLALASFALLTAVNGYAWLLFEPIETAMMRTYYPGFTPTMTALLGSWQPLVYVALFLPMTRMLITHNGLTKAMRIGVVAELCGVGCKFASLLPAIRGAGPSLILLHLGQILSAVSSPVAIGAPSQMSAEWFTPSERVRATAVGVLSNNLGNAVVYVVVPVVVARLDDGPNGVLLVMMLEAALATLAAVLVFSVMPIYTDDEWAVVEPLSASNPPSAVSSFALNQSLICVGGGDEAPPRKRSLTQEDVAAVEASREESREMGTQLRRFAANYSALLLFGVYSWTSGAFIAWTALFDHLLLALRLPFSEKFIGSLSFASTVGYILGGLVSSHVADHYLPRHMKTIIVLCCICNLGVTVLYASSLPVSEGKLAIRAAEEAIGIGIALETPVSPHELGATAVRIARDDNRTTRIDPEKAIQLAEAGFPFVTQQLRINIPLGHRQLWWPSNLPRRGRAWREVRNEQQHALATAKLIAIEADEVLARATPSAETLWALSFLGGLFNGGSAPLFYELVAEVTFPLVSEAVSGNLMSVGENAGALLMFQVVARFVADDNINWCFGVGMALSTIGAIAVKARYSRAEAFARGIDRVKALRKELERERSQLYRGEVRPLLGAKRRSSDAGRLSDSGGTRDVATGHLSAYGTAEEVGGGGEA